MSKNPSIYAPTASEIRGAPGRRKQKKDGQAGLPRAVLYLRVSTPSQVKTDYDPEGISIPAQRAACLRKVEQIGAVMVGDYVEPGVTGTSMTKRVAFQEMLQRIKTERDVDYVVVYKLSRMNRNWVENAYVVDSLRKQGVTLTSATEHIDESPAGQMMLGMLAAFNEYRSLEDSADIRYKMGEKAKKGGTLGRARLGYLNARDRSDGGNIGVVVLDPERADLVRVAFSLYATGEYTLDELADELSDRGLTSKPGRFSSRPVTVSGLQKMLRDRYYLGYVTYKGEEFAGRHEPLVTSELFQRVQDVMDARSGAGVRQRHHHHYLKGSLWCGECHDRGDESRMILNRAIGRRGGEYFYYFCRGRQSHICESRYLDVATVEASVLSHYAGLRLTEAFVKFIRGTIDETLADEETASDLLRRQLRTELERIDRQEENLLDLAADGSLSTPKVRARLNDLKSKRLKVQGELDRASRGLTEGGALLNTALDLLEQPQELYKRLGPEERRVLNMEIFGRIYIDEHGVTGHVLREPFEDLVEAHEVVRAQQALGSTIPFTVVENAAQNGPRRPTESNRTNLRPLAVALSGGGWSKAIMVRSSPKGLSWESAGYFGGYPRVKPA